MANGNAPRFSATEIGCNVPSVPSFYFPTRDVLIEAVYRTEVEKLAAAERKFSDAMPPVEALRAWMLLFVDYIATKQIIAPAFEFAGWRAFEAV